MHRYANSFVGCSCKIHISVWILNGRKFIQVFWVNLSFRHCYNRTAVAQVGQKGPRSCFSGNVSLYRGRWSTSPVCVGVFHSLIEKQKQTICTTINRKSLAVRSGTPSKTNSLSGSLQILVLAKTKCLRVNVFSRFKRELDNITPN